MPADSDRVKGITMGLLRFAIVVFIISSITTGALTGGPADKSTVEALAELLKNPDRSRITTGILYDRVLPLSRLADYDGGKPYRPTGLKHWRQMYHEIWRASLLEPSWPNLKEVTEQASQARSHGIIPIAFMNFRYNIIKPNLLDGSAVMTDDGQSIDHYFDPYTEKRVFAATAIKDRTYQGDDVVFEIDRSWYFTNDPVGADRAEIDFDDNTGFQHLRFGEKHRVHYRSAGRKTIRVRCHLDDGTDLYASVYFDVRRLETPLPHDTLSVTATIPYDGQYASGEAYIYLGGSHVSLTNPVLVIEGFDIDNTMNWEELYEIMNRQSMIESLRTHGFDAVVLNFTDATDYIQRNAFAAVELIEQMNDVVYPEADLAVVGASMGGLVGRYALAYMEAFGIEHNVRTFIAFDAPHRGANIPLGIQYWIQFFSIESEDAAIMLEQLGAPAPRQMLIYYLTDPPGTTGACDSLYTELQSDFEALGRYPESPRKVAIANGSGYMEDQGFAPEDQIILYEYSSFLVDIVGNVWAVPDGTNHIIFDGLLDRIWPLPDDQLVVYVEGTKPYDSAPGGTRASMAQMDSTEAPYGDVIALHDSHCFIPTVSALDLDTDDLFYDIANDTNILAHTPFDTVYYPVANQEHVLITAECADWLITEIERGKAGADLHPGTTPSGLVVLQNFPNPFMTTSTIRFSLPEAGHVRFDIFDVTGQHVAVLLDRTVPAGWNRITWNGKDKLGRQAATGVYFYRLKTESACRTKRMVVLR